MAVVICYPYCFECGGALWAPLLKGDSLVWILGSLRQGSVVSHVMLLHPNRHRFAIPISVALRSRVSNIMTYITFVCTSKVCNASFKSALDIPGSLDTAGSRIAEYVIHLRLLICPIARRPQACEETHKVVVWVLV